MAGDDSGISVEGADSGAGPGAGPGWLSGEQAKSVIGSMEKAVSTAQKAPGVIREANRLAAAQRQREAARCVSGARGAGVATGGGLAAAGGTTALNLTRESQAQAALAAKEAQTAEEKAASMGAEMAIDVAAIQKQQQMLIPNVLNAVATDVQALYAEQKGATGVARAEAAGRIVGGHIEGLLGSGDPVQTQAAAHVLAYWLGERGVEGFQLEGNMLEQAALILKHFGADAAGILGATIKDSEVKGGYKDSETGAWVTGSTYGDGLPYNETLSPQYQWSRMLSEAQAAEAAAAAAEAAPAEGAVI